MPDQNEPSPPIAPAWDLHNRPEAQERLAAECPRVLAELRQASEQEQLAFLLDTREVHHRLFEPLTSAGEEEMAGTYRGEPGTILAERRAVITYPDTPGLKEYDVTMHPRDVARSMDNLNVLIETTWQERLPAERHLTACARIFALVCLIHPYAEGNGHIARLMLTLLAERGDIEVSPEWTIHPRPYDNTVGIALQNYQHYPGMLEQLLKEWFGVWRGNYPR